MIFYFKGLHRLADENAWLKTILPGQFLNFPNPHCLSLSVCTSMCSVASVAGGLDRSCAALARSDINYDNLLRI